jgi:hypothetical protein
MMIAQDTTEKMKRKSSTIFETAPKDPSSPVKPI